MKRDYFEIANTIVKNSVKEVKAFFLADSPNNWKASEPFVGTGEQAIEECCKSNRHIVHIEPTAVCPSCGRVVPQSFMVSRLCVHCEDLRWEILLENRDIKEGVNEL